MIAEKNSKQSLESPYDGYFVSVNSLAGKNIFYKYTGAELGEWLEDELPRRRPRPPARLRLPRGI